MDTVNEEFHPYITRLKAELYKFHPTMDEPTQEEIKNPYVLEWQREAAEIWKMLHAMNNQINPPEKPEPKRPVISSTGEIKGYMHSDGTVHRNSEDC